MVFEAAFGNHIQPKDVMSGKEAMVVVQKGDHSLGYYDLESGEELARVPLDRYPHEFVLSPDKRHAFICHFGVALAEDEGPGGNTVSIVDLASRTRSGTLDCGDFRRPHGIDLDDAGNLYVLSEGTSRLLTSRDPHGGDFDQDQPTGGKGSHIVSVTPDGQVALSSNMFSATVTALFPQDPERPPLEFPVGDRAEGSVMDRDGEQCFIVVRESNRIAVIDARTLKMAEPLTVPGGPVRICHGPPGMLLVPLYHDRSLALVHPVDGVQAVVPLPDRPISVGYHEAGHMALCSTFGDQVCLVDVDQRRLARTIKTRQDPDPVAMISV